MGWIRTNLDFPILWAFPESLFRAGGILASFQAFINVYKHYGSIAVDLDPRSKIQDYRKNFLDPRSKILGKTSWIQGLDPRSKIQDSREDLLDPQQNLASDLGKLCLRIQEVFPRFLDLGSWIQTLDPRSFS